MPQPCSVCVHADREAIDRALVAGGTLRDIAGRFSVSRSALHRHRDHVPPAVSRARDAAEVAEADRLLNVVRHLLGKALSTINEAEHAGELRIKLAAIREARETAKLLLEVHGELQTAPTITIINSPEWVEIRAVIVSALDPYPDARQAVADALGRVDP